MSVRLSARGESDSLLSLNFARMKLSMGFAALCFGTSANDRLERPVLRSRYRDGVPVRRV